MPLGRLHCSMRIAADTTFEFQPLCQPTRRLGKSCAAALCVHSFSSNRRPGKEPVSAAINSVILNLDFVPTLTTNYNLSSSRLHYGKEPVVTCITHFTTSSRLLHISYPIASRSLPDLGFWPQPSLYNKFNPFAALGLLAP